jgi:hypothetical protein
MYYERDNRLRWTYSKEGYRWKEDPATHAKGAILPFNVYLVRYTRRCAKPGSPLPSKQRRKGRTGGAVVPHKMRANYAMNTPALTERYSRILIIHTIENHHESILKHSGTEKNNFFLAFKSATEDPDEAHIPGTLLDADVAKIQPYVAAFKDLLEALLVRNWDENLKVEEDQRRQLLIKKFVDLRMTDAATADVAMDLEDPDKNEELIRDLISEQVSKSNRKLQNEINRLSARLQKEVSKNSTGGAQKSTSPSPAATMPLFNLPATPPFSSTVRQT